MTIPGGRAITPSDLLLPPGARLVHIGPPKTGTTAIQGSLAQARAAMAERGVVYPGRERQHYRAAQAIVGKTKGDVPPAAEMKPWNTLVKNVHLAGRNRVVVSSEFFGEADDDVAREMAEEFGAENMHVVITLRPLVQLLPSAWQQYVRNRLRTPYNKWLDGLFNPVPGAPVRTTFWKRHSHGDLVERWATILGPDHVTVIMVDESDRTHLMRTFEKLTGLPEGLLVPEPGSGNRSLTHGETEVIRQINIEFIKRGWPDSVYRQLVPPGLVLAMQDRTPAPDEPRTQTPAWAIARASERGADDAARIEALGVRIVGDIAELASTGSSNAPKRDKTPVIPSEATARGLLGVISAAAPGLPDLLPPAPPPPAVPAPSPQRATKDIPARDLVRILRRRVVRRVRRKVRAARRRVRRSR